MVLYNAKIKFLPSHEVMRDQYQFALLKETKMKESFPDL